MPAFTSTGTVTAPGVPQTCCPAPPANQHNYITGIVLTLECDVALANPESSGYVAWVSRGSSFAGQRIVEALLDPVGGRTVVVTTNFSPPLCIGSESLVIYLNASPTTSNYGTAKVSGYTL